VEQNIPSTSTFRKSPKGLALRSKTFLPTSTFRKSPKGLSQIQYFQFFTKVAMFGSTFSKGGKGGWI
jgi:hypothetical protein